MKVSYNGTSVEVPYTPPTTSEALHAWDEATVDRVLAGALRTRNKPIAQRLLAEGYSVSQVASALANSKPGSRIAKTKAQKLHDQIAKLSDEDRAEYERLNAA